MTSISAIRQNPLAVIRSLEQAPDHTPPTVLAQQLMESQQPDGSWDGNSEARALNHEAMATLLRRNTFERDAATRNKLQACLAKSWEHLTGSVPDSGDLLKPLPQRKSMVDAMLASQQPDGSWNADIDASVLNHVALAGLLRRDALRGDPGLTVAAESALGKSWHHLTGQIPVGDKLLGPLPRRRTLSQAGPAAQTFHEVILGKSSEVRLHPEAVLARAEAYEAGASPLRPSATGRIVGVAAMAAAGAAAVLFPESLALIGHSVAHMAAAVAGPVSQFVAGFATGWMESSYAESLLHDKVHHAEKGMREQWKDWGGVGNWLQEGYISHMGYHHGVTFKQDHCTQFTSDAERQKVAEKLIKTGRKDVVDDDFGMTLSWKGYFGFLMSASPIYVPTVIGAKLAGASLAFDAGFAIPVALYPLYSKILHRYTHMSGKDMQAKAPWPVRKYLESTLGRFTTSHHFVHHDCDSRSTGPIHTVDDHDVCNTNLTPPFGDLARGTLRRPDVEQQEKMRRLGMLYY